MPYAPSTQALLTSTTLSQRHVHSLAKRVLPPTTDLSFTAQSHATQTMGFAVDRDLLVEIITIITETTVEVAAMAVIMVETALIHHLAGGVNPPLAVVVATVRLCAAATTARRLSKSSRVLWDSSLVVKAKISVVSSPNPSAAFNS